MFNNLSDRIIGAIYITLSAFLYASLPILAKLAFQAGLDPSTALFLRYGFAFVILTIYLKLMRRETLLSSSFLAIIQGFLLISAGLVYFYALHYLSASLATVIFFSHPVLVAILALFLYKEKCDLRLILGLFLAIVGIFLVSDAGNSNLNISLTGLLLAISACIIYALYTLAGQKNVTQISPLSLTATFSLIGIILIPIISPSSISIYSLSWQQLLIVFIMSLFNTVLAVSFFLKGIKKIGASRASLISTMEPVITLLLAFLILGEVLTPIQLLGSSLVIISIFLSISDQQKGDNIL
ncbi:MAG: DMT family transporter [Syntrophomonadaceae bacterium]|nr:DMT family transporter [Syntrophomonadaceae bacterium]MDD3024021.1 DMT family transporter [Syntrophomonadaceae bacterium]